MAYFGSHDKVEIALPEGLTSSTNIINSGGNFNQNLVENVKRDDSIGKNHYAYNSRNHKKLRCCWIRKLDKKLENHIS